MSTQTIIIGGTEYVIIPRAEYLRMKGGKDAADPVAGVDAVEFGRRSLGANLRKAREAAGLTQQELARRLQKSQPMVSGAESGRVKVGEDYVKAVLKACGLPAGWPRARKARARAGR